MHHEIKILWATHSVHHHGEEFNLSTALRQTSTGWLWKWVFYLPMIFLGVPGEVFITVAGINLVYQFWVHTEHIGHLGFLEKIFITPMNHGIHHAKNKEYIDANYGGVFIIWDRMFGTYIPRDPEIKPIYGTVSALKSWNPIWANFQIFTTMFKDSIKTKKLSDKIKVWFSKTYWRPDDCIEEKDSNDFYLKYNPYRMDKDLWTKIQDEIKLRVEAEPSLGSFLYSLVLSQKDLIGAVASILASKLHSDALSAMDIKKFILEVYRDCKDIEKNLEEDIKFFMDHDPACKYFSTPLLFYKGFLGLATYRAAHCLWNNDRHTMALFFQNRASEVFGVDIHPAARIGGAVMIDHATGVVIGETCEIESEVSIFQGVTLGGKGFESGKRPFS